MQAERTEMDKLYWMYGFWIVLSGLKGVQAVSRLLTYHRARIAMPTNHVLLTAFWTVAALFYAYVSWRKWRTDTTQRVS